MCYILKAPTKRKRKKKLSRIDRFHLAFNTQYNKINAKYKKMVERIISNRVITGISVIVGIVALVITMATDKDWTYPR